MDDEETIWRLDASCLSGFAIPFVTNGKPQYEIPVHIPIEDMDLQVSQTLETHLFPYYLQLFLSHRDNGDGGIVLLVPLNQIVSILVSDHGVRGQSLRFKLLGTRNRGVMRQAFLEGQPGRVYGVNEDDPWHLLGMLKFGEFVVRNAGTGEQQIEAMFGWTECLKRNALSEYSHGIQILREGSDGIWTIFEECDGGVEEDLEMDEKMDEGLEGLEEGDMEGSLGISSMMIPDDMSHDEPSEEDKHEQSQGMEIVGAGGNSAKYIRSDETPPPPPSDKVVRRSEDTSRHPRQSSYMTPRHSPDEGEIEPPQYSDYTNTSPEHDPSPDFDPRSPPVSPVRQSFKRPQSSSHRPYSSPQQKYNRPPVRHLNSRGFPLTGSNAMACRSRPNSSSQSHQFRHKFTPHQQPLRYRISTGPGYMPYRRLPQRRPNSAEPFRPFTPRYNQNFTPRFPIRHFNGFAVKPYDSYRPASREEDDRMEFSHPRNGNTMKKRRKVPRLERRE